MTAYSLSSLPQSTLLTTNIIDDIVINGHQLYQEIISHSNNQTPRYLGHWEIPRNLQHGDDDVLIHSYQNALFGSVGVNHTIVHDTVNIEDAFPLAFSISNYFLCTFGASTIAVFRPNRSEDWVIFYSHSRDSDGLSSTYGAASFSHCTNYDNFLSFIIENYL